MMDRLFSTNGAAEFRRYRISWALLVWFSLIALGCTTPVGVKKVDPQTVHRELTRTVLSTGKLSERTQNLLNQYALFGMFRKQPEEAVSQMHSKYISGVGSAADLSALAEMCFLHAEETGKRSYYLASALYAYAFLFPEDQKESPSPYDPRFRLACDVYNRSVTSALKSDDGSRVEPHSGKFYLPVGYVDIGFDKSSLFWNDRILVSFVPVAELEVRGLRNRYRWPGIGAPLSATALALSEEQRLSDFVAPNVQVPVTALLRFPEPRKQLHQKRVQATLELYKPFGPESVLIGGREVPLEIESTASLATMLADSPVWQMELGGFFRSILRMRGTTQLRALRPYRPGLIPVVLVHGTASSPGRWAEMINELDNDPIINKHCQFWFFTYDTGNPIPYSASILRESLTDAVKQFDPEGKDSVLNKMVVIGHSQGGLLTKMTVIKSGDVFWRNVSKKPIEELKMQDETRELLAKSLLIDPLPFVRTVIFIATPHRGSYIAAWRITSLVTRLISLPSNVVFAATDVLKQNKDGLAFASSSDLPTSVDNMTPGNRFIKALAAISVAPGVSAHSIIAVTGDGPVEEGNDGVVAYKSAHLDGVDSEIVVRSPHSCQANPQTIAEVRRILLEQIRNE